MTETEWIEKMVHMLDQDPDTIPLPFVFDCHIEEAPQ